jgi:hypothetical protein
MQMYSPVPVDSASSTPLAHRSLDEIRSIGIVDDNLDPALIEGVVEGLGQLLPGATVRTWIKPSGTAPAPDELIDEMVAEVDVAIAAIAMCGSCTAGVMLDASRLYKKGLPTTAISWEIFERAAKSMATLQGVPDLPLTVIQKLEVGQTPDDQRDKGRTCATVIVENLRRGAAVATA